MRNLKLVFLLLSVSLISQVHSQDLTRTQAEFIDQLKRFESLVNTHQSELNQQQTVVNKNKKNLDNAEFNIANAEREVRIRSAYLSSLKFGRNEQEQRLLNILNRYQKKIDELQDRFNSGTLNEPQKQVIVDQLRPLITERAQIERQIRRMKEATHLEETKRQATEKLRIAQGNLAKVIKERELPKREYELSLTLLEEDKKMLQEAKDKLAELRLQAGIKLNDLEPPYLTKVRVLSSDSKTIYYEAGWRPEEEVVKKKIELMNLVLADQKIALEDLKRLRLRLADELSDLNDKWQKLNEQYIGLIHSEKWENIIIEIGASTVGVLWNSKGTVATNLYFEAGFKVFDWFMGYNRPDFSYPNISTNTTALAEVGQIFPDVFSTSNLQSTLTALASKYVKDEGVETLVKKTGAWSAFQGMINATVNERALSFLDNIEIAKKMRTYGFGADNILADAFKSEIGKVGAEVFGNIMKGVGINAGKALLREYFLTAGKERIEVYKKMYILDLQWKVILQELEAARKRTQNEENKVIAANNLRDIYLKELDEAKLKRDLEIKKDEIVKTNDNKAVLELSFSSEVSELKINLGAKELTSTLVGPVIPLEFSLDGLPDVVELKVAAKHRYSLKNLDSDPMTRAVFNTTTKTWAQLETGEDTSHKFRLKALNEGISLVFLFDCSGSMNDQNKLNEAKIGAKKILQDNKLFKGENNEIALWCFINGSPRLVRSFTSDLNEITRAIDSLNAAGGTPLAFSIAEAGDYLLNYAHFKKRALIVLSDGEDTSGGNPAFAIRELQKKAALVKREGW